MHNSGQTLDVSKAFGKCSYHLIITIILFTSNLLIHRFLNLKGQVMFMKPEAQTYSWVFF